MSAATTLTRRTDWALHFDALLASRRYTPFEWGHTDCALFAADCVLAITGVDLAAGLRGLAARRALAHVRRSGGLAQLVPPCLPPLASTAAAQEGDVVLLGGFAPSGRSLGFGVMARGDRVYVVTRCGLDVVPAALVRRAWGVGHA